MRKREKHKLIKIYKEILKRWKYKVENLCTESLKGEWKAYFTPTIKDQIYFWQRSHFEEGEISLNLRKVTQSKKKWARLSTCRSAKKNEGIICGTLKGKLFGTKINWFVKRRLLVNSKTFHETRFFACIRADSRLIYNIYRLLSEMLKI